MITTTHHRTQGNGNKGICNVTGIHTICIQTSIEESVPGEAPDGARRWRCRKALRGTNSHRPPQQVASVEESENHMRRECVAGRARGS